MGGSNLPILQNELPLYDGLDTLYWLMDTQKEGCALSDCNSFMNDYCIEAYFGHLLIFDLLRRGGRAFIIAGVLNVTMRK